MPGGASTRAFYRVDLGSGRTGVAMYVPDASQPDEVTKVDEGGRRWPFLEVRDLLAARGVRVPELLGEATGDGFILVEDLGDDTLAEYLKRVPADRERLYQAAIADLAAAQKALADLPHDSIVRTRAFDADLLAWEIEHFLEWAIDARGIAIADDDRERFHDIARRVAEEIAGWPRGFVHRDYQSRNLMVRVDDGVPHLVWIDFQDALMGPRIYDVVALLNDSYQTFSREFVEARLDEFAAHHGLDQRGRAAVGREFDYVTVQRKLKDAGRFVFIDRKKGNPDYLPFVEPTIEKARASLARLGDDPTLAELAGILDRVFDG